MVPQVFGPIVSLSVLRLICLFLSLCHRCSVPLLVCWSLGRSVLFTQSMCPPVSRSLVRVLVTHSVCPVVSLNRLVCKALRQSVLWSVSQSLSLSPRWSLCLLVCQLVLQLVSHQAVPWLVELLVWPLVACMVPQLVCLSSSCGWCGHSVSVSPFVSLSFSLLVHGSLGWLVP